MVRADQNLVYDATSEVKSQVIFAMLLLCRLFNKLFLHENLTLKWYCRIGNVEGP